MTDMDSSQYHSEWLGIKPDSQARMIIAVSTISSILVLAAFAGIQYFLGFSSVFGGLFVGILGGLLVAGLLATISWIVYERFLPAYRHQKFQPKISGRWFGYYIEDLSDGRRALVEEYMYISQIANNISGTIIERNQQEFYRFTGQIIPGTLILNWQPENSTRNLVGAIILNPHADDRWEGIQIFGGLSNQLKHMRYIISRDRIPFETRPEQREHKSEDSQPVLV